MEDNGILDEAHGAFRRDRRTEDKGYVHLNNQKG